jgi:ABC-type Mn2+/Zn2+ transport system permease subunit
MLDWLLDPLSFAFGRRALLELILLGAVCGPLGVWVVIYRRSYAAESMAHSMLPGLVVASLAGLPLGLGAAAGLAVAAVCITLALRAPGIDADSAVAVVVTTLFGLGSLLALAPEVPVRIGELLFGNPLSVSGGDLAATAALAILVAGALAASARPLTLAGFDPQSAPSLGASPTRVGLLLTGLLAATTLIAVQALGNLLVVAIVVGPAVAALQLGLRLRKTLACAAAIAVTGGVAGLYLSYYGELAAGASIALCTLAPAALVPLARSTLSRWPRPSAAG